MAQLLRNVSGLLDSHRLRDDGRWRGVSGGGGGRDYRCVSWRTPAAWKAVIRDGKVMEWRVFADNKPVYEILARRQQ